jgi:hypothetical protein
MTNKILLSGIAAMSLMGCATADEPLPLVFARTQTVGVAVAGSVPDQGASITLGYSDRNLAVVPTTTREGHPIRSIAPDGDNPDVHFDDALSVLGQFAVNAKAANPEVGLGTFFSTGMASRTLAAGFRDQLAGTRPATPAAPTPATPAPGAGGSE